MNAPRDIPGHDEEADMQASAVLTLRDYFAAKVAAAWVANPAPDNSSRDDIAAFAYRMADAMLKARQA